MTSRDLYEAVLIELNKAKVPSLLLEDFNYFANKAITQYVNRQYSMYDVMTTQADSLRVLQASVHLLPEKVLGGNFEGEYQDPKRKLQKAAIADLHKSSYEVFLPVDYLHILNCVCSFRNKNSVTECGKEQDYKSNTAKRLTADTWASIKDNYYLCPTVERPYYYLSNCNPALDEVVVSGIPNNLGMDIVRADFRDLAFEGGERKTFTLGGGNQVLKTKAEQCSRIGNPNPVRMEIRIGRDLSKYELVNVQVEYLKVPQYIKLTLEELDNVRDMSQILEWPDYVCNEIVNELTKIIMENDGNQRLQTHIPINTSVVQPTTK